MFSERHMTCAGHTSLTFIRSQTAGKKVRHSWENRKHERARSQAAEQPLGLRVGSTYPTNVSLQSAATKSAANTRNPLIVTKSVGLGGLQGFYGSVQQVTCPNPGLAQGVGVVSAAGACPTLMGR